MRLRQIEVFYAVYTSGSMTNAAAMLNVSQPSVSKVLAHAEQQLGYQLFERNKGKLAPTPEAHQLFKHVTDVYEDVDRLRHVAANLRAATAGQVRIAGTPAFGVDLLPEAIAAFRREHTGTVFEIETLHLDEIYKALLESRIDIGLAFDPVAYAGIEAESLARGEFVVLAPRSSKFKTGDTVSIGDLSDQPFVGLNSRGPLGRLLSTYVSSSGAELDVVAWTETYHIARALVARGVGVTIADQVTANSASGGDVCVLRLKPALRFDIKVLHVGNTPLSIVANKFIEQLRKTLASYLDAIPEA